MHALTPSAGTEQAGLSMDLLLEHAAPAEVSFPNIDPSTGELLARIPRASSGDVGRAIDAASDALPHWASTPSRRRSETLHRAYELMIDEIESPIAADQSGDGQDPSGRSRRGPLRR